LSKESLPLLFTLPKSLGECTIHVRKELVPSLVMGFGEVNVGPGASAKQGLISLPAEATRAQEKGPENIDEA
jgi:hypothetical protein